MSSDSDGEEDGPAMLAALLRQRATPAPTWSQDQGPSATSLPPPSVQHLPSASEESDCEDHGYGLCMSEIMGQRKSAESTGAYDARGRYNRGAVGVKKRQPHAAYAWSHRELASQNQMGVPCTRACPYQQKCWMNIPPAVVLAAHEHVYGAFTSRTPAALPGAPDIYHCDATQALAQQRMRTLMLIWITHTTADPPQAVETYTVEGRGPVCAAFACAAYDMHRVWKGFHADAMRGELRADAATTPMPRTLNQLSCARGSRSKFVTVQWWRWWLYLEDQMPNEPTIIQRIVVWRSVFDEEYCPDLLWWGTAEPLSYPRWLALQKEALIELAVEFYGDVASANEDDVRLSKEQRVLKMAGGGFGVPVCQLSLRQRAKHSNFAACDACTAAKQKWVAYRANPNRKLGDAEAVKNEVFQHIHLVKLERQRAHEFHYLCSQRAGWLMEYDDKCGSQFLHLPAPEAGRFTASEASA